MRPAPRAGGTPVRYRSKQSLKQTASEDEGPVVLRTLRDPALLGISLAPPQQLIHVNQSVFSLVHTLKRPLGALFLQRQKDGTSPDEAVAFHV